MSRITSDLFDITELLHHGPENVTISVIKIIGALCILLSIDKKLALAAFVLGASKSRILLKHLIINSMGPIIVSFSMLVPSSIFYEATLGFLGIGLSAPQASWGTLANDARAMISSQPLQVVWPVLAICLTMLALNFIGDGLGDALDPKKK